MVTCNSSVHKAFLGQDFRLSNQFSTKMAFVVVCCSFCSKVPLCMRRLGIYIVGILYTNENLKTGINESRK